MTLPALAGTNEWTTGNIGNGAACLTAGVPNMGAALACHESAWNHLDICTPAFVNSQDFSDVTPPIVYSVVTRLETDGIGDMCANTANRNSTWSFTNTCSSISGFEYNSMYGGCAEICGVGETLNMSTGLCESPTFDCGEVEGNTVNRFYSDSGVGGAICTLPPGGEEGDQCVAEPQGFAACSGGECFATLRYTGGFCDAEPEVEEELVDEPGNVNCVSGGGVTVCAPETSQNCGTVNGESICLESVPPGRCAFLGNGGLVCGDGATGPTESDGTTPATPDGSFTARGDDAEESDFDYYGPGTVAGSGTTVTGTGSSSPTDEGTDEDCEEGGCEGTLPALSETDDMESTALTLYSAIAGAPIVEAASSIAASMPEGECPAPSLTLPYLDDVELTLDAHCELWPDIAAVFSLVMLAIYVFIGARIVLSA